jgi:glycosyltransferase involved in cell wall biosynthesis
MRILHIGEYAKGGVATYLNEVIRFQQRKFGVENIYLAISDFNSEPFDFIPTGNIKRYKYKRDFSNLILLPKKLNKIAEEIRPDIVHLHSTFAGVAFRLLKGENEWKIIYTPHGWSFNQETSNWKKIIYASVERFLAKKSDFITDISKFEMSAAIDRKIDKNKLVLIYNGLSVKDRKENEINLQVNNKKINLLFIGRFDKQKGLDLLLSFFSKYKTDRIELFVIGESVLSNHESFVYSDNIHLIGKVDNVLIDDYIKKMDALIIPSRWEGFGLVAIEAMRNKKPAIVSNRGALPELVVDGKHGYVFNMNDLNSLEIILDNLSKEKLMDMGEQCYQRFLQLFTSDKMNNSIIDIYQKALNN